MMTLSGQSLPVFLSGFDAMLAANAGRVFSYELFRDVFGSPPDLTLLSRLAISLPLKQLAVFSQSASRMLEASTRALESDRCLRTLCDDYGRCFVGPDPLPAPLWESAARDPEHLLFGEHTLAVRRWYADFDLHFARRANEPDDHLALELDFMAHLARRLQTILERLLRGEPAEADAQRLTQAQQQFFGEHLCPWVPGSLAVLGGQGGDFYGSAATLAGEFLDCEPELLADFIF